MSDIKESELKDLEKVFYPYFLDVQIKRREEALKLLEEKKFNDIRVHYLHYHTSKLFRIELKGNDLQSVINQLTEIQSNLPINADNCEVLCSNYDYGDELSVRYFDNSVEGEEKCESMARHNASNYAWKMKHQSNGIDGKKAFELYNKLINKIQP